jgi:hypothetical protein
MKTTTDTLTAASRDILALARDPSIDRLQLMELDHQISNLFRDAVRFSDSGQIDLDTYFEIKLARRIVSDLVDDTDPDSWLERVDVEAIMNPYRLQD